MPVISRTSLNPYKGLSDWKEYELITLQNGLRVMLVSMKELLLQSHSDISNVKAAAALAMQAGSFEDPAILPGCAHFLEVSGPAEAKLIFLSLAIINIDISICSLWVVLNILERMNMMHLFPRMVDHAMLSRKENLLVIPSILLQDIWKKL